MSREINLDPRTTTFSRAFGYEELPQPMKLGELSKEARTKLWSLLYYYVKSESIYHVGERWEAILASLHIHFHEEPLDEFDNEFRSFVYTYKPFFMEYRLNKLFDMLLAIMRHQECPDGFIGSVATVFEQCRLAYVVDVDSPPTIYPAATQEEGKAILRATGELSSVGLAPAVKHLRQASDCISRGDYPGAVRESIHAVESTARHFDPTARTLKPALKALEGGGTLHPALKQAFSNLYGFTSDEQGIRHALIDNPQANVGQDEAVFMLGACASFSSYLARKHQRQTP